MREMTKAVDTVRKQEHRAFRDLLPLRRAGPLPTLILEEAKREEKR
jgi:hypothetical protein